MTRMSAQYTVDTNGVFAPLIPEATTGVAVEADEVVDAFRVALAMDAEAEVTIHLTLSPRILEEVQVDEVQVDVSKVVDSLMQAEVAIIPEGNNSITIILSGRSSLVIAMVGRNQITIIMVPVGTAGIPEAPHNHVSSPLSMSIAMLPNGETH